MHLPSLPSLPAFPSFPPSWEISGCPPALKGNGCEVRAKCRECRSAPTSLWVELWEEEVRRVALSICGHCCGRKCEQPVLFISEMFPSDDIWAEISAFWVSVLAICTCHVQLACQRSEILEPVAKYHFIFSPQFQ